VELFRTDPDREQEGKRRIGVFRVVRRVLLLVVVLFFAWLWLVWPPPAWYRWAWPRQTAFMAMRKGEERQAVGKSGIKSGIPKRLYQPVPIETIAPMMKSSVLVAEDHRFYEHGGIDYVEFRHALGYRPDDFSLRNSRNRAALIAAMQQSLAHPARMRGASTITQQLAKNLYLSSSRNPLRKLKEALTAWRLEYWLGKERILELYLNVVEFGPEVWGVEAASRKYFGHSARTLSLDEAAALAGSLPFPLKSNPMYRPGRMRWRQAMIIRRIRGERVEIPRTAEEVDSVQPDTIPPREALNKRD
jgi:monofunctional biosynthetic peptidoglycan transglycosylase